MALIITVEGYRDRVDAYRRSVDGIENQGESVVTPCQTDDGMQEYRQMNNAS